MSSKNQSTEDYTTSLFSAIASVTKLWTLQLGPLSVTKNEQFLKKVSWAPSSVTKNYHSFKKVSWGPPSVTENDHFSKKFRKGQKVSVTENEHVLMGTLLIQAECRRSVARRWENFK